MSSPNSGNLPSLPDTPASDLPEAIPITLDPEVEELWSSRALLIVLLLLILSFWVSYYLKVRRIRSIHETIVALFAGMAVGLLVRLSPGKVVQDMISFKSTILLNVLLPPIILNSGYQLKQENFFRNFAVILTFAFAGTFISAVALGVIVYLYSLLGLEGLSLTIIECLLFGSTLSATDPVTILAIFNALHVDPKLYSVIFGESILNDAVAIVMFETLSQFHGEKVHILSFFHGVGIFLLTFCISMALGVIFGLSCSLMLKHSELGRYTEIESCLVFLIAYTSYFFSNALTMSGIVSLLFCGITLKHYAYHNMSQRTQRTSRYMFGILAQLSENFIFIYLGLSLFTQRQLVYKPMFILVTAVAVCIARYCAVFPISKVINIVFKARGQRSDELPHSYQMMLFWAGLRGAVGVALAAGMKGENAIALRTTVLVSVVLTVVVFGGTIGRMIEILGIRTGVEEDDESSDEEGGYQLAGMELEDGGRSGPRRKRRSSLKYSASVGGGGGGAAGYDREDSAGPGDLPYRDSSSVPRPRSRQANISSGGGMGSSSSSYVGRPESESSDESDPDVLPAADASQSDIQGDLTRVWRDGQWFTVLDERYLLPVFSNATASRRQASKKALLRAKRHSFAVDSSGNSLDPDASGSASAPGSPYPHSGGNANHHEFSGSFTDILSSLVTSATPTQQPVPKRRVSNDEDFGASGSSGGGATIDLNLTSLGHNAPAGVRTRGSISGSGPALATTISAVATSSSPQLGGPVHAFATPGVKRTGSAGSGSNVGNGANTRGAAGGSDGSSGSSSAGRR
ncbi:sodium/hydrogen exchanger [Meredithblackwellia eburnea MCA 4105]